MNSNQPARIIYGLSKYTGLPLKGLDAYGIDASYSNTSNSTEIQLDVEQPRLLDANSVLNNYPLSYDIEWLIFRDSDIGNQEGQWKFGVTTVPHKSIK